MRDKISKAFRIKEMHGGLFFVRHAAAVLLYVVPFSINGQDSSLNRLSVTTSVAQYRLQVSRDSTNRMVELHSLIPGLRYDLRYSDTTNFMHRAMYPKATSVTFLRLPAALALQHVQAELALEGLGLKIFDAYRPYRVSKLFWELVHDERYVANPAKGSGHNRGIAVDLTLINLSDGLELPMGTGFDNFTDTAHADFKALPAHILANRQKLLAAMTAAGFRQLPTEWWHFFYASTTEFAVMDLTFRQLKWEQPRSRHPG